MVLRIAHISDLHFSKICWNLLQFFSKQWIGNLNLLFSRKKDYLQDRLFSLPDLFKTLQVQHVIISGDVSTTSKHEEFKLAAKFVQDLREKGFDVITIPGNHDQYTVRAYQKKWFYDYFPHSFLDEKIPLADYSLKEDGIAVKKLNNQWWLVALDTAVSTPLFCSGGLFSPKIESKLEEVLNLIPDSSKVILVNHFPFFQNDAPRVRLGRGNELQALIRAFPKIRFYLHGHSHRHCIADLRADGLPIICDSGSTPHRERGSWNLLELTPRKCNIEVFTWANGWQKDRKIEFSWHAETGSEL